MDELDLGRDLRRQLARPRLVHLPVHLVDQGVEDAHAVAVRQQVLTQVASDETRAAGDEVGPCHARAFP